MTNQYQCEMEVRDSELDSQGIVHSSRYIVYMEHCRHKHLKSLGLDFFKFTSEGSYLVLVNCQAAYKTPLKSGDSFIVTSNYELKNRVKIIARQKILRSHDEKLIATGEFAITGVDQKTNRIVLPDSLLSTLFSEQG
jgi:acyl-CoA thioester hydrolase